MKRNDDNEVVTRKILREELAKEFSAQDKRIDEKMDRRFELFREEMRRDLKENNRVLISEFQAFVEPFLKRVRNADEAEVIIN